MELKFKVLLFGLLLSLLMLNEVESACKYDITLNPGETYYVLNSGYPDPNKNKQQCEWIVRSSSVIRLECNDTNIKANDCMRRTFVYQFDNYESYHYGCITNKPNQKFKGRNPRIQYKSSNSPLDTFRCRIEAYNENNCPCGWKDTIKKVDGKKVKSSTYSMMALIVDNDVENHCSAVIISNQYALASDHCTKKLNIRDSRMIVGENSIRKEGSPGEAYKLSLNGCSTYPSSDIALCKIRKEMKYSPEVGPVCLPFHHSDDSFSGEIVTVFGWDIQKSDDVRTGATLQKARLNIMNPEQCRDAYPDINKNDTCGQIREKDSYQMKIDGPVLWKSNTTCRHRLVGLTTSDIDYTSGKPALITLMTRPILDWIEKETYDQDLCKME